MSLPLLALPLCFELLVVAVAVPSPSTVVSVFPLLLPSQSSATSTDAHTTTASFKCSGNGNRNAENPKSNVIPLDRDCFDLSNAAVDNTELSILTNDVLPVST